MSNITDYGSLIELAGSRLAIVLPGGKMLIIDGTGAGEIEQSREGEDDDYISTLADREDLINTLLDNCPVRESTEEPADWPDL